MVKGESGQSPELKSSISDQEEKEEFTAEFSRSNQGLSDDPSRSTLHTGEFTSGEANARSYMHGARVGREVQSELGSVTGEEQIESGTEAVVSENVDGAVVGTVTVVDPDAGDSHDFEVSDDRFEVADGQLRLKPGVSLDHEDAATLDIEVTATDIGGLSASESFTVTVADVNEAPTSVSLDADVVSENVDGAVVGTVTVVDPDAGDSHDFEVSDDRFEVADGQLRLKPGVSLDHEDAATLDIEVTATDTGGLSASESFTVTVADVNEAPSNLSLSSGSENLIRNGSFEDFDLAQGRWKGFDSDESGAWTGENGIEVWDNLGRTEASHGEQLMEMDHGHGTDSISQVIQTEDGQLYDLSLDLRERLVGGTDTVEIYWNGELVAELDPQSQEWETFQLQVTGTGEDTLKLREADGESDSYGALIDNITLVAAENTVSENVDGAVVGTVTVVDPDAGDSHDFEVSDDRFEVADGQLRLKPGVSLDHEDAATLDIEVTATDTGGLSVSESFTVTVADVNEAPTSVSLDADVVSENVDGAVVGTVTVVDPDAGDSHDFEVSDDRFEVADGQLRLKPGVSLDHEDAATLDIEVTATDTGGLSASESFTVTVADVNEAPSNLSLSSGSENLIRNGSFEDFDLAQGRWKGFDSDESGAWTGENGIEVWDNLGRTEASHGEQLMEMDHGHGTDSISQVIQTEDGQLYDLSLDLRERLVGGTDTVEIYWNGELVAELDPQSQEWETFQLQVTGTGEDTLKLREADGESDSYGALIDNITLVAAENTVSENVDGAVVGTVTVVDPDAGDSHDFEVSDDRFEVADGQLRLKPGVSLDHEDAATLDIEVTATDTGGLSVSESFTVTVADAAELPVSSGFHAKYFDTDQSLGQLDDVDWTAEPTHQELTGDINYTNSRSSFWEGGSQDTFGVEISGSVEVDEAGTFEFFLGGDDGAILIVDGVPVIDNDGLHGFLTRTGEIDLEPGTHHIEVRYFENFGNAGLKLEWEGPGLAGRELVTAPEVSEAQTVSGTPLAFSIDSAASGAPEDSVLTLTGLPEGTVVEAGASLAVADGSGAVELSGSDGSLLTITPPWSFSGQVDAVLTRDSGGSSSSQTLRFEVNEPQLSAPSAEMGGGFHASYFDVDHQIRELDDLDWSADPDHEEFVPEINYENGTGSYWEGGSADTFGARLEGQITVEEGGSYAFFAGGDDGVVVFVNGQEVVDNDGLHGFRTRSGEIDLEPGTHDIEVRYFENFGSAGLKLEWEGPDTDGRELVQADCDTTVEENGTIEVGISLTNESDQVAMAIDGLPANTIVASGENVAVCDGGPIDLSGWNTDYLEISPPPGFEGAINGELIVYDTGFNGAPLTSTSSFILEVGDVGEHQGEDVPEALELVTGDNGGGDCELGWASVAEENEADDDTSDVMAESIAVNGCAEISATDTETYERVDW